MSAEMKEYVLNLLDTYQERERKIAVLRYELAHPAMVSDTEQIEMMAYGRGDGSGCTRMCRRRCHHPSHGHHQALRQGHYRIINFFKHKGEYQNGSFGKIQRRVPRVLCLLR